MFTNMVYDVVFVDYSLLSMTVISESRKKQRYEKKSKKKTARSDKDFIDDSDTDDQESGILYCFQLLCIAFNDCHFRESKK